MNEQSTRQRQPESMKESEALLPPVDVYEDANGIVLYADMAGVSKERIDVRVEGDALIIEGEIGALFGGGLELSHVEVAVPRYRRVFSLSKELDAQKVSAEYQHGVLKLRVPKVEHAQPRRIQVQVL